MYLPESQEGPRFSTWAVHLEHSCQGRLPFAQEEGELVLGEAGVDHGHGNHVESQVPRRKPCRAPRVSANKAHASRHLLHSRPVRAPRTRVFPPIRHGDHIAAVHLWCRKEEASERLESHPKPYGQPPARTGSAPLPLLEYTIDSRGANPHCGRWHGSWGAQAAQDLLQATKERGDQRVSRPGACCGRAHGAGYLLYDEVVELLGPEKPSVRLQSRHGEQTTGRPRGGGGSA